MKAQIVKYVKKSHNTTVIPTEVCSKNNNKKNSNKMVTMEDIKHAEEIVKNSSNIKVVKKEKGIIEKSESSKIILTEDNRQVLND